MIICVEGPSAVGKTTLVAALAASMAGQVVPELVTTDAPPRRESAEWSADQSSRRWQEARALAAGTQAVLLDGDPFKGLWYNAVFRNDGWPDPKLTAALYREQIENGWLAWPDLYLALDADATELAKRRLADPTRRRRRFESHLRLLAPLREYFSALAERLPGRVLRLDTTRLSADAVVVNALHLIARADPHLETPRAALVEELANWVCLRPWGRES
jgi:thymidylate kinase